MLVSKYSLFFCWVERKYFKIYFNKIKFFVASKLIIT